MVRSSIPNIVTMLGDIDTRQRNGLAFEEEDDDADDADEDDNDSDEIAERQDCAVDSLYAEFDE
jgi:hypothetical protein